MKHAGRRVVWLGLAAALFSGCGGDGLYPVQGKLLYEDGQPATELAGFLVTFTSQELAASARGEIAADGSYYLGTRTKKDGAAPGVYQVFISQSRPNPARRSERGPAVDVIYERPDTSGLEAKVEPKDNHFVFKLKRHGGQ
jgi:hypothetical protein